MRLNEHLKKKGVEENISKLILLVSKETKKIHSGFLTHTKHSGTKNTFGEHQMELDKWADKILIDALRESTLVRTVASEEQEEIIEIVKSEGSFGVTLDPLDGSSLLGVNLSVGTIVGIFDEGNVLEKGNLMDAAVYVLYGPVTTLVYCAKAGVHEFVLNENDEYVLLNEDLKIPDGKIYAPGALRKNWLGWHKKYIDSLEKEEYTLRYSGSFVADINQILHKGGIFTYPADKNYPNGKLRLLFEVNPLSFIISQAGGKGSNGERNVLSVKPESIEERTPIYIGSKACVELAETFKKEGE